MNRRTLFLESFAGIAGDTVTTDTNSARAVHAAQIRRRATFSLISLSLIGYSLSPSLAFAYRRPCHSVVFSFDISLCTDTAKVAALTSNSP